MISPSALLFVLLLLSATAYYFGLRRSVAVAGGPDQVHRLHSRPPYYGMLTALWCGLPALIVFSGWQILETDIITHTEVLCGIQVNLEVGRDHRLLGSDPLR